MKTIDILKKLRSSRLRPTKQRVEIAKFLFEREKTFHFTVESLNKLLTKKSNSKIALATIYNTVHAFKAAGHLSEVEVRGNKTYFDTNVSNHHHFYDSETSELIDIDANDIIIQKLPKAPNGKKIKNVEVFINLKN
ncbi:Fur family transcriptional regulator [Candidatus Pelagibacter communis]|uniref:Fur family transcriptional regulator n=1 Tax=Pelagibacter ubique TaxID=198252 RepID=UPI00094D8B5D|nr:transcriptional repressor [Candidatus Pelagibacter ubique]